MTECNAEQLEFHALGRRAVVGKSDGGKISSDGGGLLLGEVEARTSILKRLPEQFVDHRNPEAIEHSVQELVAQRALALALGCEDLNDHDRLRVDSLLAVLVGKRVGWGEERTPTLLPLTEIATKVISAPPIRGHPSEAQMPLER